MTGKIVRLYLLLAFITILQGCAAVAVTGAVTGASVATSKRTTGTLIEDQSIELKAIRALYADKELHKQTHVNFTSYNTIVLVTGEAPTEELRKRMTNLVSNIEKVTHVHDELTIAAPSSLVSRSSDALITSKVKTKLLASDKVQGLNIKVVTERGTVFLMGLITKAEADLATDIARKTGGVQKVVKLFQYTD